MPTVGLSPEREEKLARARLRWYRVTGIVGILCAALLMIGLWKLLEIAQTNQANSTLLVECTTTPEQRHPRPPDADPHKPGLQVPPGDCYARQRSAQGALLGEPAGPLNTVSVAAAACGAANPGDFAATLRCTEAALAHR